MASLDVERVGSIEKPRRLRKPGAQPLKAPIRPRGTAPTNPYTREMIELIGNSGVAIPGVMSDDGMSAFCYARIIAKNVCECSRLSGLQMNTSNLPILEFSEVAHVGELDLRQKRPGSYEGACLSVSTAPTAWALIAKLGDSGFILRGRGCFVDALALTPADRQNIVDWASTEGLLELKKVVRLHFLDTETEEWRYSDFFSHEKAKAETDELEEGTFRYEYLSRHVATEKLAVAAVHQVGDIDSATSFDLALIEFAKRDLSIDGVWWDEQLDPTALSAPRGGIFPERVSEFTAEAATWHDLEEFEARHEGGDMHLEAYLAMNCLKK